MDSLKLHNTAIITDEEKKTVKILVFDPMPNSYSVNVKSITYNKNNNSNRGNIIDTPPSDSGKPGMTIAEIDALNKLQLEKIPENFMDTPPSDSGEPGMTAAEIDALNKQQLEKIPENFIDTPPSDSGEPGMTAAEIDALNKQQLLEISNNLNDVPPTELEE
jgi:hypothetical protein